MLRVFVKKDNPSTYGILDVDNKTWETLICGIWDTQRDEVTLINSQIDDWKAQIWNMLYAIDVGKYYPQFTDWEYIDPGTQHNLYDSLVKQLVCKINEKYNIRIER